jgi:hypothetical protein
MKMMMRTTTIMMQMTVMMIRDFVFDGKLF